MVAQAYNIEAPQIRPGDSPMCRDELDRAFQDTLDKALLDLKLNLAYNEASEKIL